MEQPPSSPDRAWARARPARLAREAFGRALEGAMSVYCARGVTGHEHLDALEPPVLFVANHASHLDTPVVLRALPGRWRDRTAVAAAADYFYEKRVLADAVSLAFCTVPFERRGGAPLTAGPPEHLTRLLQERWSLVLYAEGTRSRDGVVGRLRPGAALIAATYDIPIVPVHISGTHEAMPTGRRWPDRAPGGLVGRRRPVDVAFGPAVRVEEGEHPRAVMERVRLFLESAGATTTPDPRLARQRRDAGG